MGVHSIANVHVWYSRVCTAAGHEERGEVMEEINVGEESVMWVHQCAVLLCIVSIAEHILIVLVDLTNLVLPHGTRARVGIARGAVVAVAAGRVVLSVVTSHKRHGVWGDMGWCRVGSLLLTHGAGKAPKAGSWGLDVCRCCQQVVGDEKKKAGESAGCCVLEALQWSVIQAIYRELFGINIIMFRMIRWLCAGTWCGDFERNGDGVRATSAI